MKNQDFDSNGHHVPRSRDGSKKKSKNRFNEGADAIAARKQRASFKNYLREIEEQEMMQEAEYDFNDDEDE